MASNEYNLAEAFQRIENELMASMIRNMDRHRAEETEEGYNWSMWQAEQLKALEKYKRNNQRKYRKQFKNINNQIEELIRQARQTGNMQQEIRILQAIKKGWKVHGKNKSPAHQTMIAEFFKLNDRKLEALIKATRQDMEKAETAVLRKAEDDYRKAIFNAQVYANTGSGTYEKAVDMATKDMLSRGLNCVEYANGARHTLADYADMAIRTASKRAYLQGEGEKRQEWGITTVIMAKRGNPCPKCLPFVGKVLIDDVWSGGRSDGVDSETGKRYPLMSYAISKGLYHPRCRDSHTTYFPGISTADDTWTEAELKKVGLQAKQEARQQYAQRQMEKYDRLAKYSLNPENKEDYDRKASEWGDEADRLRHVKKVLDRLSDHEPVSIFEINSKYKDSILSSIENAPNNIRQFIYDNKDDIVIINESVFTKNRESKKGIRADLKSDSVDERGQWTGVFHELGHRVDRLSGRMSQRPEVKEALEEDFENLVTGYQKLYNCSQKEAYADIGNKVRAPEFHSVSDLFGAMSKNQCVGKYYHQNVTYWNKPDRLGKEAFAHFFEAVCRQDSKKMDILKETFPKAYKMFEDMMEELV